MVATVSVFIEFRHVETYSPKAYKLHQCFVWVQNLQLCMTKSMKAKTALHFLCSVLRYNVKERSFDN